MVEVKHPIFLAQPQHSFFRIETNLAIQRRRKMHVLAQGGRKDVTAS
jgi:hypothetical protein